MMKLNTLSEVLTHFARFYRHDLDELALAIWVDALKEKELLQIKRAFLEYSKASLRRVMPMPGEILKQIDDLTLARTSHGKQSYRFPGHILQQCDEAKNRWMEATTEPEITETWQAWQRARNAASSDFRKSIGGYA